MRTFIAIEIPQLLRDRLTAVHNELAALLADQKLGSLMQWSGESNYHLTLRFLGDTTATQRQCISKTIEECVENCPPLSLALSGLGAFPNWRKMRVLWVGMAGDLPSLLRLQADVEVGVQGCGFAADRQGFHPHATLARVRRDADPDLISQVCTLLAAQTKLAQSLGQWEVSNLLLMRSDLQKGGAVYTPLGDYRFGR